MWFRRLTIPVLILVFLLLPACGGGGGTPPPPPPDPTCSSFTATPAGINKGESSTLAWTCNNAAVSIDNSVGAVSESGSTSVSPAATTTYKLSASGNGKTVTKTITVTVIPPPPPSCSITANPSTIDSGKSSTLAWTSANADSASLDNGIGAVALNGSHEVTPTNTTTYTLKVTNVVGDSSCSATVTVNQWHVGDGSFTSLAFTSKIPAADQTYISTLYNLAYPVAVQILGLPPDTAPLTIDLCSWGVSGSTHTICVSVLPTTLPKSSQDGWDQIFEVELAGGMLLSEHTGVGSNWIGEGYHNLGGLLIHRALNRSGATFFFDELYYDILRLGGKEIVGGADGKAWRGGNPGGLALSDSSGGQLFQILYSTQSTCTAGDWQHCNAMKDLKSALYARANACQCELTNTDFFDALHQAFSQPIEGLLADQWTQQQPIADTQGTPGTYAFVYAAEPTNPSYLEITAFTRTDQQVVGAPAGTLQENICSSGTLNVTISSATGVVQTIALDLAQKIYELGFDTSKYALGAYRVQAAGTCDGVSVTAPDSYFGRFDGSLAPPGWDITVLPNVLFLIGTNADGTPSAKTLPAPTGGATGQFLENGNGAAVWQVNGTSIPQPEYTLNGRRLYVPLPFSPVYVVENP
jgi:hypothetical protein